MSDDLPDLETADGRKLRVVSVREEPLGESLQPTTDHRPPRQAPSPKTVGVPSPAENAVHDPSEVAGAEAADLDGDIVRDLILLVWPVAPTLAELHAMEKHWDAIALWAGACHLDASDNLGIQVPPVPECLTAWRERILRALG